MNDLIGCHVGGGNKELVKNMRMLADKGVTTFQIMTGPPQRVYLEPPDPFLIQEIRKYNYIIHSPYWVSFFNPKVSAIFRKYLQYLAKYWLPEEGELKFVTHTSTCKLKHRSDMMTAMKSFLTKCAPVAYGRIKICLENTGGAKTAKTPSLDELRLLRKWSGGFVGFCFDTEHAYANGDYSFYETNIYKDVDVLHLNAIPPYVAFGKHLDRHSYTRLVESKHGLDFVELIKANLPSTMEVIMERRDLEISLEDIELYRNLK